MWSGPRNISTALMRSFGNRDDTFVYDEPFYGHYLKVTGLDHPGADEVIAHQESSWEKVVDLLTGPVPDGKRVFYQKHMAHHLLPNIDRAWMRNGEFIHVFLIRDPAEMMISLARVLPRVRLEDTGWPQQVEIFELVRGWTGETPIVIDSRDILEVPRGMLTALCDRVGVGFDEAMLRWPAGARATDGVWGKWWYANVNRSTGFSAYKPKDEAVPEDLVSICERCSELYERLHGVRLRM